MSFSFVLPKDETSKQKKPPRALYFFPLAHQNSKFYEKAGVNVTVANTAMPMAKLQHMRNDHHVINEFLQLQAKAGASGGAPVTALPCFVAGISLVLHPRSPAAPTVHANYRYCTFLHSSP